MRKADKVIYKTEKICLHCGTKLGMIVELEQDDALVQVLQVGNQYILDERAICVSCLTPVYWNTSVNKLQKLIKAITGQDIPADELDKPNASATP